MTLHAIVCRTTADHTIELHGPHELDTYRQTLDWIRTTLAGSDHPALAHVWFGDRAGSHKPLLTRTGTAADICHQLESNAPKNDPGNIPINDNDPSSHTALATMNVFAKVLVNHCFDTAELLDFIQA